MSKQKAFQSNTKYITSNTIAGIHFVVPEIHFSLCQILMSIKSLDDDTMGLFISIDEKLIDGSYEIIFTVHKDRYDEASSLVPLLCIVLEAKYGPCIWAWFTDAAKPILSKYKWDPAADKVMLLDPDDEEEGFELESDDEYMKSICSMMNVDESMSGHGFEFDINFVVDNIPLSNNQYGDSGSVKTFRSACNVSVTESEQLTLASDSSLPVPAPPADTGLESTLSKLMLSHPDLVQKLLAQQTAPVLATPSNTTVVSPTSGVDGH
jgi:hypothetical protein